MSYYAVFEVTAVHDPEAFKGYTAATTALLAEYGGRFVIRAGAITPLEGD